jgi:cysteine-rich repeat protein
MRDSRALSALAILHALAVQSAPASAADEEAEQKLGRSVEAYQQARGAARDEDKTRFLAQALELCVQAEAEASTPGLAAASAQFCGRALFDSGRRSEALASFMRAIGSLPKLDDASPELEAAYVCAGRLVERGDEARMVAQGVVERPVPEECRSLVAPRVVCGDGAVDPSEACDDGNRLASDGCSPACEVEPPPDLARWPLYLSGGLAAAGAAAGIGFGLGTISAAQDTDPGTNPSTFAAAANVSWVATGIAAAAFAYFLFPHLEFSDAENNDPSAPDMQRFGLR